MNTMLGIAALAALAVSGTASADLICDVPGRYVLNVLMSGATRVSYPAGWIGGTYAGKVQLRNP